ncbi:hypothetical protein B0H17DRAFT_1063765 [Mycena rosella]|uniref:Uncharacterized protein n=1 Tax=Mycena rosella TaxID=1033263 RepID=A0AAD7DH93_MYCRO|nr:hypothetical protein B0H17DRAFT_1063765 [Mycena rosella]
MNFCVSLVVCPLFLKKTESLSCRDPTRLPQQIRAGSAPTGFSEHSYLIPFLLADVKTLSADSDTFILFSYPSHVLLDSTIQPDSSRIPGIHLCVSSWIAVVAEHVLLAYLSTNLNLQRITCLRISGAKRRLILLYSSRL